MLSIHWASSKALVFAKSNVPNYTKKRISLSFRHALPDEYASGESDKGRDAATTTERATANKIKVTS